MFSESQLKDEAADKLVAKTFYDIGEKLNDEIDNAVNEIADETDQLISDIVSSERKVQKRFLDSKYIIHFVNLFLANDFILLCLSSFSFWNYYFGIILQKNLLPWDNHLHFYLLKENC